jgi:phage terminase large subunit-like protein
MGRISEAGIDHVAEALDYAHQVVSGHILACKWVKAACQRQIDDLARWQSDPAYPFDWRPELADRFIRYVELLPHVKGKWAGDLIRLQGWQKFGFACVFGWVRKADGYRRFRTVYEEIPRKNAKTTKLAPVGLYMLTADGEFGAEVYSAATKEEQARIVFEIAQQMARMEPEFRARFGVEVFRKAMAVKDTASKFVPLASGDSLDGLNVSCGLIDELHAHKTRVVYDVLNTGMGARAQALIWAITTAGSNRAGVCYDQRTYLTKVLNTVLKRHGGMGYRVDGAAVEDDTYWGIIYTIDEGDDPLNEETWRKANPNFGISVDLEDMRALARVATAQAAALNEFLTKRLNVWVNADSAWMNMLQWDACADPTIKIEAFAGEDCWVALDAAFKKDLFAKIRLFVRGDKVYAFGSYYLPKSMIEGKGNEHFAGWEHEGWIRVTDGEVLDIAVVKDELLEDNRTFNLVEVPFDPAQLTQFAGEMLDEGIPMVEIRPTVLNFSPAMKELEEMVAGKTLVHNGDPVMAWAIANVVCHRDAKDNIYPNKEKPENKIDPAVALIMAISRGVVFREKPLVIGSDNELVTA